jgi:hypothetical protein
VYICRRISNIKVFINIKKKEYIGNMLLEDFKKLSYTEQGKYLNSLSGVILENEDSVDINKLCQQVPCTKEEYVQEHGYISLTELQTHVNNIEAKYSSDR